MQENCENLLISKLKREINPHASVPVSLQIENKISEMIETGFFSGGEKLPGDHQMSRLFNIEHRTVRKAFSGLAQKGLIRRIKRSGTFISDDVIKIAANIGFFYFDETEGQVLRFAESIQQLVAPFNYDLKLISYNSDFFEKTTLYMELMRRKLCGAVIYPVGTEACKKSLAELENKRFPYVRFLNYPFIGQLKAPQIRGDVKKRIYTAINYLWDKGHRNIGLVCDFKGSETETGYISFCESNKVLDRKRVMSVQFSGTFQQWLKNPGRQLARGYLAENEEITALIVENLYVCIDFLRQAPLLGREVPQDLSLLCLHDWEVFDIVTPPVTSMSIFSEGNDKLIAGETSRTLLDIIANGFPDKEKIINIDHKLIERESVRSLESESLESKEPCKI